MFTCRLITTGCGKFASVGGQQNVTLSSHPNSFYMLNSVGSSSGSQLGLQLVHFYCYYPFFSPNTCTWKQNSPSTTIFTIWTHPQLYFPLFHSTWSMLHPNWNTFYFLVITAVFQVLYYCSLLIYLIYMLYIVHNQCFSHS